MKLLIDLQMKFKNKDSNYEDDNYDENLDYDENEFNDV